MSSLRTPLIPPLIPLFLLVFLPSVFLGNHSPCATMEAVVCESTSEHRWTM